MRTKIRKWGNSLGLRIPKALAEEISVGEGSAVEITVSPQQYNAKSGLALCCPITSRIKGYPFEVSLGEGAEVSGVILADQIKSLDWRALRARKLWTLPDEALQELLAKVRVLVE